MTLSFSLVEGSATGTDALLVQGLTPLATAEAGAGELPKLDGRLGNFIYKKITVHYCSTITFAEELSILGIVCPTEAPM